MTLVSVIRTHTLSVDEKDQNGLAEAQNAPRATTTQS
jgi:hypothetical protein